MVRATWKGAVIAESDDVEVVDGYSYFPVDAVDQSSLRPSSRQSVCPWKGTATYFDVVANDDVNSAAAWCYPEPSQRAAPLVGGRIAFWKGVQIEGDDSDGDGQGLLERITSRFR